jgi:hypothetical protein
MLSKVPAKVEEFARDYADIQICTALLRSMTRGCARWHRSQFWLAIAEVNSEFCGFRDETLTFAPDKKRDTAGDIFWRSGTLKIAGALPLDWLAVDLDARQVDEPSPPVATAR